MTRLYGLSDGWKTLLLLETFTSPEFPLVALRMSCNGFPHAGRKQVLDSQLVHLAIETCHESHDSCHCIHLNYV